MSQSGKNLNMNRLMPRAKKMETAKEKMASIFCPVVSGWASAGSFFVVSASSRASSAEKLSMRMPTIIISKRFTTPLTKGMPKSFIRAAMLLNFSSFTVMLPAFLRTATVIKLGERIITPSITAWPPTAKSIFGAAVCMAKNDELMERVERVHCNRRMSFCHWTIRLRRAPLPQPQISCS